MEYTSNEYKNNRRMSISNWTFQGRGWLWNLLSTWHKIVRWSTASCTLVLACRPYVQNNKKEKYKKQTKCQSSGLANTRISTSYAQKSPRSSKSSFMLPVNLPLRLSSTRLTQTNFIYHIHICFQCLLVVSFFYFIFSSSSSFFFLLFLFLSF